MAYDNVRYEVDGFLATITIAREKALNALNNHTLNEIGWALREADGDTRIRVVIVTGAGDKAFVAGADIAEMQDQDATAARGFAQAGRTVGDILEAMTKPVIASKGPLAIAYARKSVRKSQELFLAAGNDLEGELFALLFATQDQKEGMKAFLAKRPAKFEGK